MSAIVTLASEVSVSAASVHAAEGLIDWGIELNSSALNLIRLLAITLGILFVVIRAVATRGAMSQIIVAGIAAAIFIWIAFNVTELRDAVGNDLPGASAVVSTARPAPVGGFGI